MILGKMGSCTSCLFSGDWRTHQEFRSYDRQNGSPLCAFGLGVCTLWIKCILADLSSDRNNYDDHRLCTISKATQADETC